MLRLLARVPARVRPLANVQRVPFARFLSTEADAPRETMEFDVVIVGAGPAGLSAAIRLKQLAAKHQKELSVCVVEKGAEVGAHVLSGNVFDPCYLTELIPDWKQRGAPLKTAVTEDKFVFLTQKHSIPLPTPASLQNHGNYVISLGQLARWLGSQAQELGVDIFPGFAASEVLYSEQGAVVGVATKDMGIGKDGAKTDSFQRGVELRGKQTLFAEGARGSLSELVMQKFNLRKNACPQTYGLGVKEVWEIDPKKFKPGFVLHAIGYPLDWQTYGGAFLYHMEPNLALVGFVAGLDYPNPYISPYEEFQRWKLHPTVRPMLEGGKCIGYGGRVLNEGGLQALPKLTFPGGALIGCAAGFLNVPRLKGSHNAIKTGMLAAESIFDKFAKAGSADALAGAEVVGYQTAFEKSPVYQELYLARNYHPAFRTFGGFPGWMAYSALEAYLFKGKAPWTLKHKSEDFQSTRPAGEFQPISYPKPDGKITFDLLTNLARSGVNHNENQPAHLTIRKGLENAFVESYSRFAAPESRFCPAKVYEYVPDEKNPGRKRLQINAQNCVHCKTCDIKTPKNFIQWTVPEGGGGPAYENM